MRYFPLFVVCLAACLLCFDTTSRLSFHWLTASVVTSFLVSWPTGRLPRLWRGVVQLVVGELLIAVCLIDCYCQEFFATAIGPQVLSNVILSNAREIHEFLAFFMGFHIMSRWRIVALLLLAVVLPFAVLCKLPEFPAWKTGRRRYAGAVLLALCLLFEVPTAYRYGQLFFQRDSLQSMEGLIFRHYHEEVPTPLHRLAFAWYSLKQSSRLLGAIRQSTFAAPIDSCTHQSPHIVLVIGESSNKHHSTLYGYQLPTTPLQQQRMDADELYVFRDVVSPWNITSNVFLDIFSLWEYGMEKPVGAMPLFPILFRRAGYSVNFFSNQYVMKGFLKSATNQAGHFFLADGEMSDSLFSFRNERSRKYDMGLVTQVRDFRKEQELPEHTLDIIHLIGQHFDYDMRYPQDEATFSVNDYAARTLDAEAKKIVMQYDNATHYNDMVLDSILSIYDREDAVVLYVADHGEEVYDDLQVHGRLFQEPTAAQARYEFEVPMWIWCSERYRQQHPDVVSRIREATNKPLMTDALPQLLLSLAGITCPWSDERRNPLSVNYQGKRRIIGGSTDYDELMKPMPAHR